jgi:hypothetical protein
MLAEDVAGDRRRLRGDRPRPIAARGDVSGSAEAELGPPVPLVAAL